MIRSFPRRFLLTLALVSLVLGSAGCARPATPTPATGTTALVATEPVATATAAATSQARPTATPDPRPTAAPIPGGLAIATPSPGDRLPTVRIDRLPREAHDTIRLIAANGPFPYRQDGVVFENRERLLPAKATGYYHEYTVKTPGSPDRGARRLIRGRQNELYYTDDHYDSFRRVTP
jgi:ribonuclease T1